MICGTRNHSSFILNRETIQNVIKKKNSPTAKLTLERKYHFNSGPNVLVVRISILN